MYRARWLVWVFLLCAGCTSPNLAPNSVQDRAAYDLGCPREQIEAVKIASNVYAAEGCDRKATYNCQCTFGVGLTCTQMTCKKEGS